MTATSVLKTQFATLSIGATAQRIGISATELHNRLKRHDLVHQLLLDCYDTVHAESIDSVVWNVQKALKNWEAKEKKKAEMRDQVLGHKTGRIAVLLAERLNIDAERALDILYNSRTYTLLSNPESGLHLHSDVYILTDLLRESEA